MKEIYVKRVIIFAVVIIAQLVMLILKSFNVVDIDWGWVFAPLWISYSIIIFGMAIIIIYVVLKNGIERIKRWKNGST